MFGSLWMQAAEPDESRFFNSIIRVTDEAKQFEGRFIKIVSNFCWLLVWGVLLSVG